MAQTRCTTAHSPSRCLFLYDGGGDNNSNIVSFDFRLTIAGKKSRACAERLIHCRLNARSVGNWIELSRGLNSIASNPIRLNFLSDYAVYMTRITQSYCNLAINPIRLPACNRTKCSSLWLDTSYLLKGLLLCKREAGKIVRQSGEEVPPLKVLENRNSHTKYYTYILIL